jgi:hypothetical protein
MCELFGFVVYYRWMNSKAKAEGCKYSGCWCYEAERAAACMTLCLPHTLVEVRAGLRGEGALFFISSFIYSTGVTVVAPAAGNLEFLTGLMVSQ